MGKLPVVNLYTDGACPGNPGAMGIGGLVRQVNGKVLAKFYSGADYGTSNIAEYCAAIQGIKLAMEFSEHIVLFSDSMLLVNHIKGKWRCKHPNLRPLLKTIWGLKSQLKKLSVSHIPREQNTAADKLSRKGLTVRSLHVRRKEQGQTHKPTGA